MMVTLAILSGGLVALYRSFFICFDTINHLTYRLHAITLLENRIATIEKKYRQVDHFNFDTGGQEKIIEINNRDVVFHYEMNIRPVENAPDVHQLDISLNWQEGAKDYRVSKSAYFSNHKSLLLI